LVSKLEANNKIGAISPKIKFFYHPDTIQYSGQAPINPYTIRSRGYGYGKKDNGQFETDTLTSFVHGAAMMIPVSVIKEVGLMAEIYFLYYEELDWGTRIKKAGYELWYVHNSTVMHKESVSTGKLSPFKTFYMNRSRIIYLRRNASVFIFPLAMIYQIFVSMPKNVISFILHRKFKHLSAYSKAIMWHLKNTTLKELHTNPVLNKKTVYTKGL